MRLFSIDPGPVKSAYVERGDDGIVDSGIIDNDEMLCAVQAAGCSGVPLAIEMIASYGMPVGEEVFETCVWIGRFIEAHFYDHELIYRKDVKMHLCGTTRAKDANIRQRLIDLHGGKEKAIGKKSNPGTLYGFKADMWAALAVDFTARKA